MNSAIGGRLARTWIVSVCAAVLPLSPCPGADGATSSPAATELALDSAFTGKCQLTGPGGAVAGGLAHSVTLSLLNRRALSAVGWYWGWGLQADNYSFGGDPAKPSHLRDCAGLVSLEYHQGGETVAALTLHPGWYFENRAVLAAWDVPVELTVGVPIGGPVSGVVGFSNARFYHHALPVAGLVWVVNSRMRLELVYPEPALVMTLGTTGSLRLGGTLSGAGFLADTRPVRTAVEFSSYRVGAEVEGEWRPGVRLTLGAGVELERSFDFFAQDRRWHGHGARYVSLGVMFSG